MDGNKDLERLYIVCFGKIYSCSGSRYLFLSFIGLADSITYRGTLPSNTEEQPSTQTVLICAKPSMHGTLFIVSISRSLIRLNPFLTGLNIYAHIKCIYKYVSYIFKCKLYTYLLRVGSVDAVVHTF